MKNETQKTNTMKYVLIALLFCTCGSSGEVEPTYFDSHFIGTTYYPDKPDWQLADGTLDSGYHIESGLLYNFEVKDTLPAKPLNIKMKPRWRDSLTSIKNGAIRDMTDFELGSTLMIDSGYLSKSPYDTFLPKIDSIIHLVDTVKIIMLCSDTSSQNGYRTQRCYWMYGWEISELWMIFNEGEPAYKPIGYLDDKKVPLSKNLVVWMSKELK